MSVFFMAIRNPLIFSVIGSGVRIDDFISFSVYVHDFNSRVFLQYFSQFCDIDIHTTSVEVVIFIPNGT